MILGQKMTHQPSWNWPQKQLYTMASTQSIYHGKWNEVYIRVGILTLAKWLQLRRVPFHKIWSCKNHLIPFRCLTKDEEISGENDEGHENKISPSEFVPTIVISLGSAINLRCKSSTRKLLPFPLKQTSFSTDRNLRVINRIRAKFFKHYCL